MNPHRRSGIAMLALAWTVILGGLYWMFHGWVAEQNNPNTAAVLRLQRGEVTLERSRAGHYLAEGEINGKPATFLLDTGATWVALSARLGRELGLKRGAAVTMRTANGTTVGYQTRLTSVRIGSIELRDVAALISDGIDEDIVLLGMSFLKRVEFVQRDGRLILRTLEAAGGGAR